MKEMRLNEGNEMKDRTQAERGLCVGRRPRQAVGIWLWVGRGDAQGEEKGTERIERPSLHPQPTRKSHSAKQIQIPL